MPSRRLFLLSAAGLWFLGPAVASAQAPAGDSTLDRIRRDKILRVGATGEAPFFAKDQAGAWSGMAVDMARDIAAQLAAKLEFVETAANAALGDLQSGKFDLAIGLPATPKGAVAVEFTKPFLQNAIGLLPRKGFSAAAWAELDKPEIKMAVQKDSDLEATLKRLAPNATVIGFKTRDDALGAVQSGRADGTPLPALAGLLAAKGGGAYGEFQILHEPRLQTPVAMAVRAETDRHWRDFLDVWIDAARGNQLLRAWLATALGIKPAELPPDLQV